MSEANRPPAGLSAERVSFFTDAVFAIAMTLLVIEIPRPEGDAEFTVGDGVSKAEAAGNFLRFLSEQSGSFIAYGLAFYLLWNAWRSHHRLFDDIAAVSHGLLRLHFPYLLVIGFLPYATTSLGHHTDNPAAALLFTLAVGVLMALRAALQPRVLRDGLLRPDADRPTVEYRARLSWIIAIYWLATVVFVWWTPWIILAWLSTPLLAEILERRRAGSVVSS